jgi:hypothetical protein
MFSLTSALCVATLGYEYELGVARPIGSTWSSTTPHVEMLHGPADETRRERPLHLPVP